MAILSNRKKHVLAISLVLVLVLVVYSASSALDQLKPEPEVCAGLGLVLEGTCLNDEKGPLNNFKDSVRVKVENGPYEVNGFSVKIMAGGLTKTHLVFKTVAPNASTVVELPLANIESFRGIELKPLVNQNQQIHYCGLTHGARYTGVLSSC